MNSSTTHEALKVMAELEADARDGYVDLGFHNFEDHVVSSIPYLVKQWAICDENDLAVDKKSTGVAWLNHDIFFHVKGDSGFESKEKRSAYIAGLRLYRRGWNREDVAKVCKPILATEIDSEITDINDLVVVRTDLHNIWEEYPPMANNALILRREEEKMSGKPIEFEDFQDRIKHRLGSYLARDMGLIEAEYCTPTGEALPNYKGKKNLNKFLNETPESLSQVLGITEAEIIQTPKAA